MLLKFIVPLLSLTILSCAAVDPVNTNAINSVDPISTSVTSRVEPINTTLVLDDHLYEIQQKTSTIKFRVDSPVGEVWGSFNDFNGSFTMLNNGEDNQSAMVDVNTESLHTDSFLIQAMLKSEVFFNVEKFPSMQFIGGSFEWFNDKNAVLKGYLTINNVTRPVAFYVKLVKLNTTDSHSNRVTVNAETTIRRSEFGINSMLSAISDDVNLFMSIDALRKNTTVSMM